MSEESLNTGTLSMKESKASSNIPYNVAAGIGPAPEGGDKKVAASKHNSSTHGQQKNLVHQIVSGWDRSDNSSKQIASLPRPPSPTVPPPAWDGRSVKFACINAFDSSTDASGPTATAVLCRHCRCPSQTIANGGNQCYERMVSYQKDSAVKVSLWESAATTFQLDPNDADSLSNCDQILLCISMLDIWSSVRSEIGMKDMSRLWKTLAGVLFRWKIELKDISKPVNVVLLGIVKPSDGPTRDDFASWFSSESFKEIMKSICMDRNMRWFSPILQIEKDGITPVLADSSELNKKRKFSTSFSQNLSVDFCFQSMVEQALQEEKDVVDTAADAADSEVNDESPLPVAKKQRKENTDTISPNSVVIDLIDLTTAVSADADEDSPKIVRGKSSPARRSPSKAYSTRNRR